MHSLSIFESFSHSFLIFGGIGFIIYLLNKIFPTEYSVDCNFTFIEQQDHIRLLVNKLHIPNEIAVKISRDVFQELLNKKVKELSREDFLEIVKKYK